MIAMLQTKEHANILAMSKNFSVNDNVVHCTVFNNNQCKKSEVPSIPFQ